MPLLDVGGLCRNFGPVRALVDVSLVLQPGTVGLVGNNGAGKSTLLKILLGLLPPDAGGGTVLGCDIRRETRLLRGRIGYMPEAAAIVPMLRGVEFVTLSGDLYGMPHQHARRRAHEVLNYVGLGELRYRRLEEYSTGNIQRLKLAAALVHDPELLLLDEPTNGLDPAGRQSMLELIKGLIAETGKSVVLCTHLLSDVERLCEQVVILHRGTAVMAGGPTAAGEERTNRYEAAWIGNGEAFLQGFQEAGGRTGPVNRLGRRMLTLPTDWTTREVFSLAQSRQAVITYLIPDEEDLEQMFFRVTDGHATASAAVRG